MREIGYSCLRKYAAPTMDLPWKETGAVGPFLRVAPGVAWKLAALVATVCSLSLAGCRSGGSRQMEAESPVVTVSVTPQSPSLVVHTRLRLTALLADAAGNRLASRGVSPNLAVGVNGAMTPTIADVTGRSGRIVSWRSSEPSIVAVDGNGRLSAHLQGSATITASSESISASTNVTVVAAAEHEIDVTPTRATVSVGQSIQFSSIRPGASKSRTGAIEWSTNEPARALVNSTGLVTALAPGTAVVVAQQEGKRGKAVLDIRPVEVVRGLDFPGSAGVVRTMRFEFKSPLSAQPATYIWRAYPRQQASYYSAFFWGNRGAFFASRTYYGFHPYPDWSSAYQHFWEIAAPPGIDLLSESHVIYDRWYIQVAICRVAEGVATYDFYWDWPDKAKTLHYVGEERSDPPAPVLAIGGAPWNPGQETWDGVLRGFQFYDSALTEEDIDREITSPGSVRRPWYLNINPAPDDISDKSGSGNNPSWVGVERPAAWTGRVYAGTFQTVISPP